MQQRKGVCSKQEGDDREHLAHLTANVSERPARPSASAGRLNRLATPGVAEDQRVRLYAAGVLLRARFRMGGGVHAHLLRF